MSAVILPISNRPGFYSFRCPGCNCGHQINVDPANPGPCWTLTGSPEKPTIRASVLVTGSYYDGLLQRDVHKSTCHSFVTDGRIEFLNDCTHSLAGQTVDLEAL